LKAALINDLSGLGRCSLVADIAVLSAMGITACPAPTAVLSAQTAYPVYSRFDFAGELPVYLDKWRAAGAAFDGILTGYFTGADEAGIAADFVQSFSAADRKPFVLVDPVMGDDGRPYSNFSDELCRRLQTLCAAADVITPNLTELWLLTGGPAGEASGDPAPEEIRRRASLLLDRGCKAVVVTGIARGSQIGSLALSRTRGQKLFLAPRCPQSFCGTGDVFAAIVFGGLLRGDAPDDTLALAAQFISSAAMSAMLNGAGANDGIDYEKQLYRLIPKAGKE
jgi:pyridoxine kinase